tara:strand:- start:280 stop:1071 length:792 start_codon:yes stop_codon:yes gene_type:complete
VKIKAKKSLGQNFLIDKNIIKKIVEVGEITSQDTILEIGAGTGNLTEFIVNKKPQKFFVIEKDHRLIEILKQKFKDKVIIINNDILKVREELISEKKLIVFGNLPYNISTKILSKWITNKSKKNWYKCFILMFQKEVADRIIAEVNTKNYGRLSILSSWKLKIEKITNINSSCFYPKPKIKSTLLKFTPKNDYFQIKNSKNLETITKVLFNQRRKMIKKSLNSIFKNKIDIAKKLNLNLNLRPQNLSPELYYEITREYENLIK